MSISLGGGWVGRLRRTVLLSFRIVMVLSSLGLLTAASGQVLVGRTAPEFVRTDLSGKRISLKEYRGKVVLLNFWATWCGPCIAELPMFERWQSQFESRGMQVLGVSMDDSAAPVRAAYLKYAMDFPVVMGDATIGEAYGGVLGVPVTFLINRQGMIVRRYEGPVDAKRVEADVEGALATAE